MNRDNIRTVLSYCNSDFKYFEISKSFEQIYTSIIYTSGLIEIALYEDDHETICMLLERKMIRPEQIQRTIRCVIRNESNVTQHLSNTIRYEHSSAIVVIGRFINVFKFSVQKFKRTTDPFIDYYSATDDYSPIIIYRYKHLELRFIDKLHCDSIILTDSKKSNLLMVHKKGSTCKVIYNGIHFRANVEQAHLEYSSLTKLVCYCEMIVNVVLYNCRSVINLT